MLTPEQLVASQKANMETLYGLTAKAFEGKVAEGQAQFAALVDNAAKNAPAGSETAVAMMKSAVAAANNAFESVQKAVKQATDVAEANFNAVTTSATTAAKNAGAAAKKAAR